jgi:hypothetical protein
MSISRLKDRGGQAVFPMRDFAQAERAMIDFLNSASTTPICPFDALFSLF